VERSVADQHWKLITSTLGKHELYDLSHDPQETRDLWQAEPEVGRALQRNLAEWLRSVTAVDRAPARLDKRTLEILRSLGYVQ
jgi:hypothetical protein